MDVDDEVINESKINLNNIIKISDNLIESINDENMLNDDKNVECKICGKKFIYQCRLKKHEKSHNYKCELCNITFLSYAILLSHNSAVHFINPFTKEIKIVNPKLKEQLICVLCPGKIFTKKRSLLSHKSVVHGEKNIQCSYCPKSFAFDSQLQRHVKHHRHKCDLCFSIFGSFAKLDKHRKEIHQNVYKKAQKLHFCSTCNENFTSKTHFSEHVVSEHTDLVFECNICHRTYKYKRNLREHIKGHNKNDDDSSSLHVQKKQKKDKKLNNVSINDDEINASDTSIIELLSINKEWKKKNDMD